MIHHTLRFIIIICLASFFGSTAFGFIAEFPITGIVPGTGEVISGRYVLVDAVSNPEPFSLQVGKQGCSGLLYRNDEGSFSGHFNCLDGRNATFQAHEDWFLILKRNPNGRIASQSSISGQGNIAGEPFTLEFNTALPVPFIFR
ncbi:hypothetical protein [Microvirga flavescens]|uniref:hypothetical protein n=1 Tax=Microvirga flavescens TaxID=2249811 RepID=UPI0013007772|nr:hypothetical protein [Microvirga flavescens]